MDEDDWDEREQWPEDQEPEEEYGCNCGYFCMDCLGLTWNDFM